jgi:hypothetical protein
MEGAVERKGNRLAPDYANFPEVSSRKISFETNFREVR